MRISVGCRLTKCKSAAGAHVGALTNLRSLKPSRGVPPERSPALDRPVGCICWLGGRLAGASQAGRHAFKPLSSIRGDFLYLRPISQATGREKEVRVDQPHETSPV